MEGRLRDHRWALVVGGLCLSLVLSSCARESPDDIVRNRGPQLEELARSWWEAGEITVVNFGDGSLRWNGALIVPASGAWDVQLESAGNRRKLASLAEAAEFAGTTEAELTLWIERLRANNLYAIARAKGAVELVTGGGFLGGVGLLFVVSDRDDELDHYLRLATSGSAPGWHKHFRQVSGRWFAYSD